MGKATERTGVRWQQRLRRRRRRKKGEKEESSPVTQDPRMLP